MSELVTFDTETNGMVSWKEKSEGDNQPHIVQIAALRVDEVTRQTKQSLDIIIKPVTWDIDQEMTDIHGITKEYAMDVGVPEDLAIEMFLAFHEGCSKRLAYNTTFDNRIIRIGIKRYIGDKVADKWKAEPYECQMIASRKHMGGKNPKLAAAYQEICGKELVNAHTAMADTVACMDIYFALQDIQAESGDVFK